MNDYQLFKYPQEFNIQTRKLENYKWLASVRDYYNRNPVIFMRDIMGAELTDQQAWMITQSWNCPNVIWIASRGFGKSSLAGLFIEAKGLLNTNHVTAIASGSGAQSIQTFTTLEKIANAEIESMPGLTGIFAKEVSINNATGQGFIHNPSSYSYQLMNSSSCLTVNSNIDRRRGLRANLLVMDEVGFMAEEPIQVFSAFTVVNRNASLGGSIDAESILAKPRDFANQILFVTSASSTDTALFKRYKDYSKKYLEGDPKYFVADVNCEIAIHPTVHGKPFPTPFLEQSTVDAAKRADPDRALREYYNVFTQASEAGAIIKRAWIARNSVVRPPVLGYTPENHKIVLAYDPARSTDDSVIVAADMYEDPQKGLKMDIINAVSFADLGLKKKTPMRVQEQVVEIRKMLLDYNGAADDYDNIAALLVDAGSGGGGNSWVRDLLIENWKDRSGKEHKGLIDKEYSSEYVKRFPDAINKLKMIEPARYKSEAFESLIKMVEADLITFPDWYDEKGYLSMLDVDTKTFDREKKKIEEKYQSMNLSIKEYEEKVAEETEKLDVAKIRVYNLTPEEEASLGQLDLMKTEILNIVRYKRDSGKDAFKLPADKDAGTGGNMHDDLAYALALLGLYLSQCRAEKVKNRKTNKSSKNLVDMFTFRKPKAVTGMI